jgi:hypothetical protein
MDNQDGALTHLVEDLKSTSLDTENGKVHVGRLIDALEHRGYGPALTVLPLIELTPLGGIPGLPTLLAVAIGGVTVRLLMGYRHFWIPRWLRHQTVASDKVEKALGWLKPLTLRVDAALYQRMSRFAGAMARRIACIVILCLLVTVPPLELVPFATSAPMIVISVFGLAILFRDGLLMLSAFGLAAIALSVGLWTALGG